MYNEVTTKKDNKHQQNHSCNTHKWQFGTYFTETLKFRVMLNWYRYDIEFMPKRYWCSWWYCYDINFASSWLIAKISWWYLRKRNIPSSHFDGATIRWFFKKKSKFSMILILRHHDITTIYCENIVTISSQRNVISSSFR